MQAPERGKAWKALEVAFGRSLTRPLAEACRTGWQVSVSEPPAQLPDDAQSTVYFRFTLSGSLEGDVFLVIRHSDAMSLSLRDAPEYADGFGEEHYKALSSAVNRCTGDLQESLLEYGVASVRVEAAGMPELPVENSTGLSVHSEDPSRKASMMLIFDEKVIQSLKAASAKAFSYPAAESAGGNLDLVMDVALNVTLRFGQRRLSLREVLDLTSGSVVELDRQVDEPVELVLDGRVVARGEAVIIDGNYGLRITQVVQSVVS
ncbi:Flagellar motor switch protein FliN [Granulicella sibirica]|uniref:Flagellar motor switch protein FliN n=1 Tax=Granulicella sibirica TaxID=2479048 RepID=A0A4Q0T5B5_9BACT|nr:Flagellar motor switch protein FliN [Granulicella sibirica]